MNRPRRIPSVEEQAEELSRQVAAIREAAAEQNAPAVTIHLRANQALYEHVNASSWPASEAFTSIVADSDLVSGCNIISIATDLAG